MIEYNNLLPESFYKKLENIEGKYALNNADGNFYRFTNPPYQIAIDFENIFLGIGIPHQCDAMYFSKRPEKVHTVYKQFENTEYTKLIYFVNQNYIGGEIELNGKLIIPQQNKAIYFDSEEYINLKLVEKNTQYLLISFFRKNSIKRSNTII